MKCSFQIGFCRDQHSGAATRHVCERAHWKSVVSRTLPACLNGMAIELDSKRTANASSVIASVLRRWSQGCEHEHTHSHRLSPPLVPAVVPAATSKPAIAALRQPVAVAGHCVMMV
jgi:hypothetical protein